MDNKKIGIVIVLIVIIVVGVICILTNKNTSLVNNEPENLTNTENKIENNTGEENTIETENVVEENTSTENVENKISEPTSSVQTPNVYEENTDVGTTDKKQEAINLVKEKWGEDNSVSFRCDSITAKGEYIIAVVSTETASVKNYFKVNLENKLVEIDY